MRVVGSFFFLSRRHINQHYIKHTDDHKPYGIYIYIYIFFFFFFFFFFLMAYFISEVTDGLFGLGEK